MTPQEIRTLLETMTPDQQTRAAIYAAQTLGPHGPAWDGWAARWLSGEDRSSMSGLRAREAWDVGPAGGGPAVIRAAARAVAYSAGAWIEDVADALEAAVQARPDLDIAAIVRCAIAEETT